jgi:hypothetical protein
MLVIQRIRVARELLDRCSGVPTHLSLPCALVPPQRTPIVQTTFTLQGLHVAELAVDALAHLQG